MLNSKVAKSYGTAAQPMSLLSINPTSFLNGFGEEVFRKVRVLRLVDTSLVDEEVAKIGSLKGEYRVVWSTV